ncbi:MAG: glycosyltransferase [Thiobacillus sp.]|nr:glycosyltransferase [Thiobacillus sp.]
MTPIATIIMPCHNASAHLPSSVGSVMAQTFSDWELIAIDDGSTDHTLKWLRAQTDPRLRVHAQPNQGVSAARNAGLAAASGLYVAFLDADDTWDARFLDKMVAALQLNPDAMLAYCGWQNVGLPGDRSQPFVPPDYEAPNKRTTLFAGCRWPIHAALTRREAILSAGGFDPRLKNAEDYALWLEIAGTQPIVRVPDVLAYYHFHGTGQASDNQARAALQLLAAQQAYLDRHPEFGTQLGNARRVILYEPLMQKGYAAYWKRDLPTARVIFRRVMQAGFGGVRDWLYMLPSLLPLRVHQFLLGLLGNNQPPASSRTPDRP